MTDWEKLKVTELKEELKSRGIPLTGLKLKQQLVDKLNELDNGSEEQTASANQLAEQKTHDAEVKAVQAVQEEIQEELQQEQQREPNDQENRIEKLPEDLPIELKHEESLASNDATPPPIDPQTKQEEISAKENDPFVVQDHEKVSRDDADDSVELDQPKRGAPVGEASTELDKPHIMREQVNDNVMMMDDQTDLKQESTATVLDGQRKRKRSHSSSTSVLDDKAQKRAKTDEDSANNLKEGPTALEQVQIATDTSQAVRTANGLGSEPDILPTQPDVGSEVVESHVIPDRSMSKNQQQPRQSPNSQSHSRSHSPVSTLPERNVTPAIHAATSSLYIRNFKRPLHIPTLRAHIASIAKSQDSEALTVFYLDSVRTHAFVTFKSISDASRVRNAMHGARFPDEPMRDPLWIDFIPDEKVQTWIDRETENAGGGFGGGRSSSQKFEVRYDHHSDGVVEAILQEATYTNTSQSHRSGYPVVPPTRTAQVQDPKASAAVASGIHPSRSSLVPQSPSSDAHPGRGKNEAASDVGTGFRALDELFSSTRAKPKLYFKLPSRTTIDLRLDMIRDLRVGHEQMGRTGDEGMKRYSFEREGRGSGSREDWVDKGPEFGFGRRGQERLTGFGSSYGHPSGGGSGGFGPRGRGAAGFRGRRGGDSWRGR